MSSKFIVQAQMLYMFFISKTISLEGSEQEICFKLIVLED